MNAAPTRHSSTSSARPLGPPLDRRDPALSRRRFRVCAERVARFGPVFRTRILGRETVVISGPEATAAFNDEDRILRSGAIVPHVAS